MDVVPMVIDGADERKGGARQKKAPKRKKSEPCAEEKLARISELRNEVNSLVKYCKDLASEWSENMEKVGNSSAALNGVIACLMEESDLPLSKLVDRIFEKVNGGSENGDGFSVTKAGVKSIVLEIGKRSSYGVKGADADVLEDEDECALWCWETRDMKLMPKSVHGSLKVRRACRGMIQDRITTVSAMVNVLEKSENSPQELVKASEKLNKVLNESDIRLFMERTHKNGVEMAEKDSDKERNLIIKQIVKQKKELEREKTKKDRELQFEKLESEKELKLSHDEAEKEKRRREKEIDIQKQLKRQQEKDQRNQRRKEKEEAELKDRVSLQKQASFMECFLKRSETNSSFQNDISGKKATTSNSSSNVLARTPESVTLVMDSVLAQNDGIEVQDIWKSHLDAWRSSRYSMHSNRKRHWGIRQKPKTELIKELKLTSKKKLTCEENFSMDKPVVEWGESSNDRSLSRTNIGMPCSKKRVPAMQLLQFDKSNRPAFYGVWPRKSQVVGARRPFAKDPDIKYDIDSDEEWEEDEPGESLSDCDEDDENIDDDGDEIDDGLFVPDGYLSEDEIMRQGFGADAEDLDLVEEVQAPSTEICTMLRQQNYLNKITERALRKDQPLIILNLAHDKTTQLSTEELTGIAKIERTALQALCLRPFPGFPDIDISVPNDVVDEGQKASSSKSSTPSLATDAALLDSYLPEIISTIQSFGHSIKEIETSLHDKFPAVPRSQLRNKVWEIAEFTHKRWKVKEEMLSEHGMNKSPEKMMSIATIMEKSSRLLSGETKNMSKTSPQSSKKPRAIIAPQQDSSCGK